MSEKLKMSVKALMACGPKCFRCKYEMPSGPVDEVFFVLRIASTVMPVVNGGGRFLSKVREWRCRTIRRSSRLFVSREMLE